MKVTFLGTGTSQGVPVIACTCEVCQSDDSRDKRLRTSVHIEIRGKHIVIDTGPDFRTQMLRLNATQLNAVLFTHTHKDHTAGLDDIRPFCFKQKQDIPVYATYASLAQIKKEFAYIFAEKKYPGVPQVQTHTIDTHPFYIDDVLVTPISVLHGKMPVLGFRIGDFSYITDASEIKPQELEKVIGSKVFVLNALRKEPHHSHFNLAQALEITEAVGAEQTYFTHISHYLGKHAVVLQELPKNISLAYDGLTLEIP